MTIDALKTRRRWRDVVHNAAQIQEDDLYTLRLRTLQEPAGPPAPDTPPIH